MKLMPIPDLTQQEFHAILAGLDELPGKIARVLHNKLTEHATIQIEKWRKAEQEDNKRLDAVLQELKDEYPSAR